MFWEIIQTELFLYKLNPANTENIYFKCNSITLFQNWNSNIHWNPTNAVRDTFQYVRFTYFPISPFSDVSFEGLPVLWNRSYVLQWINWKLADGWSLIISTICSKEYGLSKSQCTFLRWEQDRWFVIDEAESKEISLHLLSVQMKNETTNVILPHSLLNFISLAGKDFIHGVWDFFFVKAEVEHEATFFILYNFMFIKQEQEHTLDTLVYWACSAFQALKMSSVIMFYFNNKPEEKTSQLKCILWWLSTLSSFITAQLSEGLFCCLLPCFPHFLLCFPEGGVLNFKNK